MKIGPIGFNFEDAGFFLGLLRKSNKQQLEAMRAAITSELEARK